MKFVIICPDVATGGTECLHQLGHAISAAGFSVALHYFNEGPGCVARNSFSFFGLDVIEKVDDCRNQIIIFPENLTKLTVNYKVSTKCIFWLSVDNFFPRKGISRFRDFVGVFNLRNKRRSICALRTFLHISQSEYASEFLLKNGIKSSYVGDFLNDDFFYTANKNLEVGLTRLDQVCFNPAKGKRYIDYLIKNNPTIRFIPIVGMTRDEVVATLAQSKMYLDLGLHPGKDRIPREAAVMGCCVATSRFGSAGNRFDVPIPDEYKFNVSKRALDSIPVTLDGVFCNFEVESKRFDDYRAKIRGEKEKFYADVTAWLNSGII